MTMPKFEPVAKVLVIDEVGRELVFNLQKPLHTADQLTEAYEAGKREASEDLEQAAFEKWLYDKCPSGDVESVQRQWLESYEYAELAGKMEQAAQINHLQMALADTEALEIGTGERLAKVEQQLAAALAACQLKDSALENITVVPPGLVTTSHDMRRIAQSALASQLDNQALEQFAAKVREQCQMTCLEKHANGNWKYDTREECAEAIRAITELPK